MPRPVLCCVTSKARFTLTTAQLLERVRFAADAGVDFVQVRERDLPDRALVELVRAILMETAETKTRVLVNDRLDVALAAGAAGVHLRGDAIAASSVRAIAPPGFVIGRSIHSVDEAAAAQRDGGCDFLLFGTVFASGGKPAGHPIAGVDALRAVCAATRLPVLAIGGIDEGRAREAARAGAAGAAAVRLFMDSGTAAEARARVAALCRAFDTPFAGCLQ